MSDKKASETGNRTPDKSGKAPQMGTVHPEAVKMREVADAASGPDVAQGLQSVMAVIGENYDPAVSGAVDKDSAVEQGSRLTDKIDAARQKQSQGSSVKQGLQSIMAVIGEEYEEDAEPAKAVADQARDNISGSTETSKPATANAEPITPAPQDIQNAEAASAISDLVPLLTRDEQDISRQHEPVETIEPDTKAPGQVQLQAPAQQQPVSAPARNESTVADLLNQLKRDISTLEKGNLSARQQFNMPAVIDNAAPEVKTLLAELQGDISALRSENETLKQQYNVNVPTVMAGQGSEISSLLAQLQGDIAGLRQENDALKKRAGAGGTEISALLAQLQGDISGLRKENDSYKTYYNNPRARRGTSIGQAFLMTVGLLSLVGGATVGGMYYANSLNTKNNENLRALLGLVQAQKQKEALLRTPREPVVPKPVIVKPKIVPKPVAVKPAPPPALPKITVRRPQLDSAEVKALLADAQNLIELGDLVSARQMLEYAMSQKSAEAAYQLARTYDPLYLATMASVLSVEPNITRAKVLYYSAARQGHQAAAKRLAELRRTSAGR